MTPEQALDRMIWHFTKGHVRQDIVAPKVMLFFQHTGMVLNKALSTEIDTACTDGSNILYNPDFLVSLSLNEQLFLTAHEIMHCVNNHHIRFDALREQYAGDYSHELANICADLSINDLLKGAGFAMFPEALLPAEGLFKSEPPGLSLEVYYARLLKKLKRRKGGGEGGGGDGSGRDGDGVVLEGEMAEAAKQAKRGDVKEMANGSVAAKARATAVAKAYRSQLSGGQEHREGGGRGGHVDHFMSIVADQYGPASVPFLELLRQFMQRMRDSEYTWFPCDRRFVYQGLYLPQLGIPDAGDLVVLYDTSGSIGKREHNTYAPIVRMMSEEMRCKVHVIYHDTNVRHEEAYDYQSPTQLEPKGGGGTDHRPAFEYVLRRYPEVRVVVCLTDLCTCFPDDPGVPVIWGCTDRNGTAPFGDVFYLPLVS